MTSGAKVSAIIDLGSHLPLQKALLGEQVDLSAFVVTTAGWDQRNGALFKTNDCPLACNTPTNSRLM